MKKVRRKRILGNLILVIISFGISAFLAEILARQIFPIDTWSSYQYRIPHPIFGWVLEPNASYLNEMPEATVRVTYNSKGWRDVEHSFDKSPGTFRILVLGDSFMEAYSVELNDTFAKRIEQFAREKGRDVEVINLGVGGYGTLQEYLVFREVGELYKPNLVLLGFYLENDLRNNSIELETKLQTDSMKTKSRPFLDLADSSNWKITVVDFDGAQARYAADKARQNFFLRKLVRHSALLPILSNAKTSILERLSTTEEQSQDGQIDQERRNLALYGVNYCQNSPEYTKAWNITKRILARLKLRIETVGSELLVFTVPGIYEVDVAKMEEALKSTPKDAKLCLEEAPAYERLKNILKELNIEYVDLLPDFHKVMQGGGTNLFRHDRHWSPESHSLAAKLVGARLLEKNLRNLSDSAQGAAADH